MDIPPVYKGLKEANNRTIAILIKLFATNIIANRRLGRSKRDRINEMFFNSSSSASLRTALFKEKATSAPEINAEENDKCKKYNSSNQTKDISNDKKPMTNGGSGIQVLSP